MSDRLESWKEIASYLGRGVRTARRWEAEEGLPVHRHVHKSAASVYAFKEEIDAWRSRDRSGKPPRTVLPRSNLSIVVVPFGYLGPNADFAYVADGFTEEIISNLSQISALRVISRTSSFAMRNTKKDSSAIGRQLDVAMLLEGTVRHKGNRIRVTTRLIDTATDEPLSSDRYNGKVGDIFEIQESIATAIAETLRVRMTTTERSRIATRPIDNVVAWQCAMQARQESLRWHRDAIERAIHLLESGLSVVGDNAALQAALGRTHLQYREAWIDVGEEPLRQARLWSERAEQTEPGSAKGLQLDGWIAYSTGDVQTAVGLLKLSADADLNDPDTLALLANCFLISGMNEHARPLIDRLVSIDPLTPLSRCMPGWLDVLEGRFDSAVGHYRAMFELDPSNPMGRLFYAWALALDRHVEEADELIAGFPEAVADSVPARIASLLADALTGRNRDSEVALSDAFEATILSNDLLPRFLAQIHAIRGDAERAVRWMSRAVDRGFINYPYLSHHDPFLARMSGCYPYELLLEEVKKRWESFEA